MLSLIGNKNHLKARVLQSRLGLENADVRPRGRSLCKGCVRKVNLKLTQFGSVIFVNKYFLIGLVQLLTLK